jgi:AAA15 family ATPase/GTPase
MVVEFSVKNFRSIKDLQTISFLATGLKSSSQNEDVDIRNIVEEGGKRFLKTIGLYGANASGKTNVIRALEFFFQAIRNEASSESNLGMLAEPFLYQESSEATESFFQIVILLHGKKYRYGFTVAKNPAYTGTGSKEIIYNEWLYGTKERNTGELFLRKGQEIWKEGLPNRDNIPPLPYAHSLFLTHAAAFDAEGACAIIRGFIRNWTRSNFIGGFEAFRFGSIYAIELENRKQQFLELLAAFNLKYDDVTVEVDRPQSRIEAIDHEKIFFTRHFRLKDNTLCSVRLNLHNHESAGTRKLFDIAGFLLRAFTMPMSGLLILDEIDSDFHPALLIKLIGLFNDPAVNKSNVQLLFTSHDTNIMSPELMRRDQFYFTEKTEENATRVYALSDLKGIRNDADFARNYLAGFYGGIPVMHNFLIEKTQSEDERLGYQVG